MSIYRIYKENNNSAGFWVQHRGWQNMCARVQSIGGQNRGSIAGVLREQPNAEVIAEFFDVRSGRSLPNNPVLEHPEDRGYVTIAQPPWYVSASKAEAASVA